MAGKKSETKSDKDKRRLLDCKDGVCTIVGLSKSQREKLKADGRLPKGEPKDGILRPQKSTESTPKPVQPKPKVTQQQPSSESHPPMLMDQNVPSNDMLRKKVQERLIKMGRQQQFQAKQQQQQVQQPQPQPRTVPVRQPQIPKPQVKQPPNNGNEGGYDVFTERLSKMGVAVREWTVWDEEQEQKAKEEIRRQREQGAPRGGNIVC